MDQIIEMISMIVMDVVSIQGPPSISMIQILPGENREHQQLPLWERLVFKSTYIIVMVKSLKRKVHPNAPYKAFKIVTW